MIYQGTIKATTNGEGDILDVSEQVRTLVRESNVTTGVVTCFVQGSTAALTTIEYEPGVLEDFKRALAILAPENITYAHDQAWGDGNGRSHVKAALVGPSLSIPILNGQIVTGTWQQIVLVECDTRTRRDRRIICTVVGEIK